MFSQTAEYALRAMTVLAARHGEPVSTACIAQLTQVSPGYLARVLRQLAKAGLLDAKRGKKGGFVLSRKSEEISVLEVLRAVKGAPERIRSCPLGKNHECGLCPLHSMLDRAIGNVEHVFETTTIDEVMQKIDKGHPLCPPK